MSLFSHGGHGRAGAATHDDVGRRLSRSYQVSLVVEGLLVGLAGGGVVTLFRLALSHAESTLRWVVSQVVQAPALALPWACALAGFLLVVSRLIAWEPDTAGSGIPQVEAEVAGRLDSRWPRVLLAKFAECTLVTLSGLSMGREGPSVQLGGMTGKAVSRALRRDRGEERLLVTCGAAAGMSAAFHAPLTGVLFALEEIHRAFTAPLIISVMCSAIAADFLVSQVLGVTPVLALALTTDIPHPDYALVVLLGAVCGLLGVLHNRGMFLAQGALSGLTDHVGFRRLAPAFALAGLASFAWPEITCGGDAVIERVLSGPQALPVATALALLAGKYLLTAVCFGSGTPGGTLFPLVAMGSLVGAAFAGCCALWLGLPGELYPNLVALGIAGLFAGVIQAPVTAVVLVFELTGSLDALLSASIVSIVAYVVANLLGTEGFYEHLLSGLLAKGRRRDAGPSRDGEAGGRRGEKGLLTYVVGAGSPLDGARVEDVSWPAGSRLVVVRRGGGEVVPRGATVLRAFDELIVIADETDLPAVVRDMPGLCAPDAGLTGPDPETRE